MNALLVIALLLGQDYAPPRQGLDPLAPEQEARVQRVGKKLRCAVCQGVAITDSPASMARAQLDKVRELVRDGKSDDEIYDYFVARYGEWVLLEPTKGGLNAFLWVGPGLFLAISLVILWAQTRRNRAAAGGQPAVPPAPAPASESAPPAAAAEDAFLAQVRADLEK